MLELAFPKADGVGGEKSIGRGFHHHDCGRCLRIHSTNEHSLSSSEGSE
jgi:hypothetical protein